MSGEQRPNWIEWLWPHVEFDFSKSRPLGRIVGAFLMLIFAGLTVGVLGALVTFILAVFHIGPYQGQTNDEAIRNIGLVLAAVFGAPFVAWRSWVAQRQTDIQEQGHITDRINTAVQGLGAEKSVRRHRTNREGKLLYEDGLDGKLDLKKPVFDELTVPNLEVRIGSLFALERVANESAIDRAQIFEILCAYVSNNFEPAENFPHERIEPFGTDEMEPSLDERIRSASEGLGRDWASQLKKPRPDTHAAISVLLRCVARFDNPPSLSFSGANLQRVDFAGASLVGATFEDCSLDGANFERADLSDAKFFNCSLIGASINSAVLSRADFRMSRLECVNAGNIKSMDGCMFWDCDCSGIMFDDSNMSYSHLSVVARKARFRAKSMDNTRFSLCDVRDGEISAHSMYRLHIHGTWVPESGVQLMERVKLSGQGAWGTRMAKKVRLWHHPSDPKSASSSVFDPDFLGFVEIDQGDAELFDPDTVLPAPTP